MNRRPCSDFPSAGLRSPPTATTSTLSTRSTIHQMRASRKSGFMFTPTIDALKDTAPAPRLKRSPRRHYDDDVVDATLLRRKSARRSTTSRALAGLSTARLANSVCGSSGIDSSVRMRQQSMVLCGRDDHIMVDVDALDQVM